MAPAGVLEGVLRAFARRTLFILFPCLLLAALSEKTCEPTTPGRRPLNIVLVLADALRACNLSLYGYARETAPNLTALGRTATVFTHHLANYPGTPVSLSQLFTGRLMPPLLIRAEPALVPVKAIPRDLAILPLVLKGAGYRTGLVTSHPWFDRSPLAYDFERRSFIGPDTARAYAPFRQLMPAIRGFLEETKADPRPFLLYVHAMDTHTPRQRRPRYAHFGGPPVPAGYDEYDEGILYLDEWVGRILEDIDRLGLAEQTIFVFTSDHGEELHELGPEYWNAGHGYSVRRAQLHVPLIVRVPTDPRPGRAYEGLSSHIDLTPTLLRLAVPGLPLDSYRFDGRDRSGFWLRGDDPPADTPVHAYSMRYWGVFTRDLELYHDEWTDTDTLSAPTPDGFNYPFPSPVEDPVKLRAFAQQAARESRRRYQEFRALPGLKASIPRARIGVPTTVDRKGGASPTYEERGDDDRWSQNLWLLLECGPREHPGPIVLSTPWVPGRYRLRIRLDAERLGRGYRNQLSLEVLGPHSQPRRLRAVPGGPAELDAGVYDVGNELVLRIADPVGGVAISGLDLESLESPAVGPTVDPALEERLRALGYLR
jgi:arylsulfatase A-like enzyme